MIYLILVISLAGIVLGADWLVSGAATIAKRLRVSEFVIGAVIGSNIFNVLGILLFAALNINY